MQDYYASPDYRWNIWVHWLLPWLWDVIGVVIIDGPSSIINYFIIDTVTFLTGHDYTD